MKSQEKVNMEENMEKACVTKEEAKEFSIEDTGVNVDQEKLEMESKHQRNVLFQDCQKEQDSKTKDPTHDVKTPNTEKRTSCLIKYNVSTMPYLQMRRSQRLQEKTSKLPDVLKDHYPCASSTEQLTELGRETKLLYAALMQHCV
ncbi:Cytoskeleton-associated protein 2, partial [Plecturocebus cupreus]